MRFKCVIISEVKFQLKCELSELVWCSGTARKWNETKITFDYAIGNFPFISSIKLFNSVFIQLIQHCELASPGTCWLLLHCEAQCLQYSSFVTKPKCVQQPFHFQTRVEGSQPHQQSTTQINYNFWNPCGSKPNDRMDHPGSRPWLRFGEWCLMILIGRELKPVALH